ncbi:choline transporter [Rhizodiscina lignyota]|uniref:Choline transporter n=1 Tax=Rhizodiscina lignyota TaxID=1504668 RepID=A0A9P4ICW8_9PEZI|nr:choline transporter [Rhizodiscina lignyota]
MSSSDADKEKQEPAPDVQPGEIRELVNASGHVQELDRTFGFWSICAVSLITDNAWAAGTGALTVALFNGGPPGVLYEYIVACLFYFAIGAGLAELASAIPSSASVYHWASVTAGPKYSRICSWYAGWWNTVAWAFGAASVSLFGANSILAIYNLYHEDYVPERWHIFLAYLGFTWLCCGIVLFGQRILPHLSNVFGVLCMLIWFVTLMVVAIMPSTKGSGYASNAFVWRNWQNQTGYSSNGFVFLAGMLNGAFAIGTPDGCTHLAEEIPEPKKNIPKGVVAQLTTGFFTTFFLYIALLYAISDLDAVLDSNIVSLPLATIYLQATGSKAATAGLLIIFIIDLTICTPGAYITAGRMLWTMARDDAVPFSNYVAKIDPTFRNQFRATFIIGCVCTVLGCIYIGSRAAFNAFVGCFAILTTLSYVAALLPHILTGRKYIKPGHFYMYGWIGPVIIGTACAYIIVFNVIYMFPYALPLDLEATMNWNVVLVGGVTIFMTAWYLWKRTHGHGDEWRCQ